VRRMNVCPARHYYLTLDGIISSLALPDAANANELYDYQSS